MLICLLVFWARSAYKRKDRSLGDALIRWRLDKYFENIIGKKFQNNDGSDQNGQTTWRVAIEGRLDPLMYPYYRHLVSEETDREILKDICLIELEKAGDGTHSTYIILNRLKDRISGAGS